MAKHDWESHHARVNEWMKEYAHDQAQRHAAKDSIRSALKARLDDDGLNYHAVDCRVKESPSLESKLLRRQDDGHPKYPDGFSQIDDVIGARVITFLESEVTRAIDSLTGAYKVIERVNKTAEQKEKGAFGYSGQHLILEIDPQNTPGGCHNIKGQRSEVQIRTILQHAWAEFEHDVRYKNVGTAPPEINRAFTLASGLIELAGEQFDIINDVVAARQAEEVSVPSEPSSDPLTGEVLQALLEGILPNHPRSRAEHYEWLKDILHVNGVTEAAEATELFSRADWSLVWEKIEYKIQPGHVRAADDVLLHIFTEDYIKRTTGVGEDNGRAGKLRYRLKKLRGR
ncbi:hypothetical protein [Arthrobacter sp. H5]|uniref:GTP pyrophosphokinase n=1 Tax=Arthrobacter sp. H5 TaxID=1267973 RepID=UPI000483A8C9|nr:hypothetical protein [Arthrobacter sp. H5]